jgi:hypothetical protein
MSYLGLKPHADMLCLQLALEPWEVGTPVWMWQAFAFLHAILTTAGAVCAQVDQLLAVQFREDMTRLTEHVGRKASNGRQTILVSATLTQNVRAHTLFCAALPTGDHLAGCHACVCSSLPSPCCISSTLGRFAHVGPPEAAFEALSAGNGAMLGKMMTCPAIKERHRGSSCVRPFVTVASPCAGAGAV